MSMYNKCRDNQCNNSVVDRYNKSQNIAVNFEYLEKFTIQPQKYHGTKISLNSILYTNPYAKKFKSNIMLKYKFDIANTDL